MSGDDVGTADLEKLAAEVSGDGGYQAHLLTPAGKRPCLRITNRLAAQLGEYIYAGKADDGQVWFWWGWAERIAPAADIADVAYRIKRVLRAVETR